ncbi:MAG: chemotaxis protein CheA [Anaerolineales bacterium]|nr:chemotaxis protein CheA [Anaerolineales bacterium]
MGQKLSFDIEADELEIFLEEANEHLQSMEAGILRLEHSIDPDVLNAIFRAAHTLKALAGTIGHHRMAELTHTIETLFDAMRTAKFSPDQAVIDDLLTAVDILKALRDEIITLEPSSIDATAILTRLGAALTPDNLAKANGSGKIAQTSRGVSGSFEHDFAATETVLQSGQTLLEITLTTTATAFAPAARLSQAVMALMEIGRIVTQNPTMMDLANARHNGSLWLILATSSEIETIQDILAGISDLADYQVQPYEQKKQASQQIEKLSPKVPAPNPQTAAFEQSGEKTVRISVERLDALMNLVGELVTSRNRLLQLEGALRNQHGKTESINDIGEVNSHFSRMVDRLQEEVMRARMLPIASLFDKFPRIVRDVARTAGKQVNLVVEGEATELDRTLIEAIGDPLVHLLRNAIDHGLESPEDRLKASKPAAGTVRLTAAHLEGQIVITVEDDGRGIDPNRVRRAAVSRELLTEAEVAQLDDDAAIDLIFRPNLSTAEQVTKLSGRGVGMDVVRSNVERLSGSVVVESKLGMGTTFRVTLPLTLAIVQAMLVSVQEGVYAIPLASIVESLYLVETDIHTIKR